ncbi:hypothetical protein F5884DRAFT_510206 [Xylogone sp. PMI_703]|nr:hypothetical protein F5884DRAFT_510206 [Xylogone sp. PMI_703]
MRATKSTKSKDPGPRARPTDAHGVSWSADEYYSYSGQVEYAPTETFEGLPYHYDGINQVYYYQYPNVPGTSEYQVTPSSEPQPDNIAGAISATQPSFTLDIPQSDYGWNSYAVDTETSPDHRQEDRRCSQNKREHRGRSVASSSSTLMTTADDGFGVEGGAHQYAASSSLFSESEYVNSMNTRARLDSRFQVNSRPQRFFKVGRVFMILWIEPMGASSMETSEKSVTSDVFYGESAHAKIRRFVVVRERKGCCLCCPILTYGGKGTTKQGVVLNDHAVVFVAGKSPKLLPREEMPSIHPFPITLEDHDAHLDPASRLNFGKIYTIEHNLKVRNIGRIDKNHIGRLGNCVDNIFGVTYEKQSEVAEVGVSLDHS